MSKKKKKRQHRKAENRARSSPKAAPAPRGDAGDAGLRVDRMLKAVVGIMVVLALAALGYIFYPSPIEEEEFIDSPTAEVAEESIPDTGRLTLHWQATDRQRMSGPFKALEGDASNICAQDYAGPEACSECHKQNYEDWKLHSHRLMNASATHENVAGDFVSGYSMNYKGGRATFFMEGDEYRMRYESDDLTRSYKIKETIGSRFFQYYIGVGLEGPEPSDHDYYSVNHVLPFGYWIHRKAWVPIVHIFDELSDDERDDPLFAVANKMDRVHSQVEMPAAPSNARGVTLDSESGLVTYATSCNYCHTTFPLGDMLLRASKLKAEHLPAPLTFSTSEYLAESRPDLWDGAKPSSSISEDELLEIYDALLKSEAADHAVTLGISCEACHLGCKSHAKNETLYPAFMAVSEHLRTTSTDEISNERTASNINWVCSRCHNGNRPRYAGGISTWNSTEFTDMSRGGCFSEITCIECHDPHKATGLKWSKSPAEDDGSCLKCHEQFETPEVRLEHTHHPAGTPGDRCMNCHMPKINEGMQDVVRTHTIFSPTQTEMLEENNPNACNLCHLEKPIDWTLKHLQDWYGKTYSEAKLNEHYEDRGSQQVGLGWLQHPTPAVRLVAADALLHSEASWAMENLVDMLDDDYLLNRQFTQQGFEHKWDTNLDEEFGYWFYMTKKERQAAIQRIRNAASEK